MASPLCDVLISRVTWTVWVCLVVMLPCCTAPLEPDAREPARNNEVYFDGYGFKEVYAARLHNPTGSAMEEVILPDGRLAPQVLLPLRRLSPAHRADVSVSLASSSIAYTPGDCFVPRHAIVWKENEKVVTALLLSFACNTYRFEPAMPFDLRDENIKRLRNVFEENGMIDEDS